MLALKVPGDETVRASAMAALRAMIGHAACLAMDDGALSPSDVDPLAGMIREGRSPGMRLH